MCVCVEGGGRSESSILCCSSGVVSTSAGTLVQLNSAMSLNGVTSMGARERSYGRGRLPGHFDVHIEALVI
jgi:hypothetical protein